MQKHPYEQYFIEGSQYLLEASIAILEKHPYDHLPDDDVGKPSMNLSHLKKQENEAEKEKDLAALYEHLNTMVAQLPENFMATFIDCSLLISDAIGIIQTRHLDLHLEDLADPLFGAGQIDNYEQFLKAFLLAQGGFNMEEVVDSIGFTTPKIPFNYTINTFLGPEATKWMQEDSINTPGKVQPHEMSRVNWVNLRNMQSQIKIETELLKISSREPVLSKAVVSCLWCMKGLASIINPNIFISESKPHVSLVGEYDLILSHGVETHTFVNYYPGSFIPMLKTLKSMVVDDILEAADMMWIALGLAEVRNIQKRHELIAVDREQQRSVFLSHRGKDSKKQLMDHLLTHETAGVFLDCLSLPRKLINRNFVFGNLVNSKQVLLIKTPNFSGSIWCLKEERLCELLKQNGEFNYEICTHVEEGIRKLSELSATAYAPNEKPPKETAISGSVHRILNDGNIFNGPRPSLYTLHEKECSVAIFSDTIDFLQKNSPEKSQYQTADVVSEIDRLLDEVLQYTHLNDGVSSGDHTLQLAYEYLCVTMQLTIALLSLKCPVYDKMEVRKYINIGNKLCKTILKMEAPEAFPNHDEVSLKEKIVFLASCIALELSGHGHEAVEMNGVDTLNAKFCIYKNGLLLLNVMKGVESNPMFSTMIHMISNYDIGTVGILQDANHQVHQGVYYDFNLEVVPCVTFHAGMEAFFE